MTIELGPVVSNVRKTFAEKVRDIMRGHTIAEEASVLRMLSGNISPEDIEKYKEKQIRSATLPLPPSFVASNHSIIADSVLEEIARQKTLTPEQLVAEVAADARQKVKQWKLKLGV
ncbi:MAG: hypothetical protein Q7R31_00210 [Candidatus Levybacteria bacterium]|nr:hypothetical protein [Candidatus Levybacteria bacterium]